MGRAPPRGAVPRGVGGEWPSFAAAPVHALAVDRGCQVVVALAGSSCGRSIRRRSGSRHAARPTVLRCQLSSVQRGRGERVRLLQAGRPGGRARRAGWFGCARCRSTHVEGVQGWVGWSVVRSRSDRKPLLRMSLAGAASCVVCVCHVVALGVAPYSVSVSSGSGALGPDRCVWSSGAPLGEHKDQLGVAPWLRVRRCSGAALGWHVQSGLASTVVDQRVESHQRLGGNTMEHQEARVSRTPPCAIGCRRARLARSRTPRLRAARAFCRCRGQLALSGAPWSRHRRAAGPVDSGCDCSWCVTCS